jgi:hypothetical protein
MHPHPIQNTTFNGLLGGCERLSASSHPFTFNGQERTDKLAVAGNHNTALYWEYDTRLGMRWDVDPNTDPPKSNYTCIGINPDLLIDLPEDKEFKNYDAYKKALESDAIAEKEWTGQNGHW